tara:strand:+ start:1184 stop:1582 length:399 start_codon:yes stop_codon:yes gene_type:complete
MCKCSGTCGCNITSTTKGEKGDVSSSASLGYKVYTILLTQAGNSDPVATILQNTLSGVPVWTRNGVGDYTVTLAGVFTVNKTWLSSCGISGATNKLGQLYYDGVNTIGMLTFSGIASDDILSNTSVEIRVYP